MTKLLDTERQYQLASNRSGILKDLKRVFDTSSRDKEAAIQAAHRDRDLKQAVEEGNVEAVKQVTKKSSARVAEAPSDWAAIKFKTRPNEGVGEWRDNRVKEIAGVIVKGRNGCQGFIS